jgi:hypothetical protein
MAARVKQRRQFPGKWISSSDIRPFVKIASQTTQRKISSDGQTAMLLGDDVIDWERVKRIVVLVNQAILAPVSGAVPYKSL